MNHKIFVNLPVNNLRKSINFYTKLGNEFNPMFTDKNAGCLILDEKNGIYAMLLMKKFFRTFTKKKIVNPKKEIQAIVSLSVDSRQKVNALMNKALKAGATEPRPKSDMGFMYQRAFEDLDGHNWEVFYMDMKKFPKKK